jgi:hypothetical protein
VSPGKRADHLRVQAVLAHFEGETDRIEERVNRLENDTALIRRHFERIRDRIARLSLDLDSVRRRRLEDS